MTTTAFKPLYDGGELNQESWNDVVSRMTHDCVGAGVELHHTGDAVFLVEEKKFITGIDDEFAMQFMVVVDDSQWPSPEAYYNEAHEGLRGDLDEFTLKPDNGECKFLEATMGQQVDALREQSGISVYGYVEGWELLGFHLTIKSAEEYIRKHAHKHSNELRISYESMYRCHELNTIRNAIISGKLVFKADV